MISISYIEIGATTKMKKTTRAGITKEYHFRQAKEAYLRKAQREKEAFKEKCLYKYK